MRSRSRSRRAPPGTLGGGRGGQDPGKAGHSGESEGGDPRTPGPRSLWDGPPPGHAGH